MPKPIQSIGGEELETCKLVMSSSSEAVSRLGGRLTVLYQFVGAALPQLSAIQRIEISRCFRTGIEDVLSHTEDIVLPAEYHEALVEQTHILLSALATRNAWPE